MGRPTKEMAAVWGGPLRGYWQAMNRQERAAKAAERAEHKVRDRRRPKCRCQAYPWPHRPGGGLCRFPDPPVACWQRKPRRRPYCERYAGIRRQLARANGFHPIRDRMAIDRLLAEKIHLAKQLKQAHPHLKYRNMEITATGVRGNWQTAGPQM